MAVSGNEPRVGPVESGDFHTLQGRRGPFTSIEMSDSSANAALSGVEPLREHPFDCPTLVVAAHPDDESLGCGATMARMAAAGNPPLVVIMGRGLDSRGAATEEQVLALRMECMQALSCLGVRKAIFLDLPDNRFDSLNLLDLAQALESIIDEFSPGLIITHHRGDLNIDHRLTFQAVITALRPQGAQAGSSVLCMEIPSSTEWAGPATGNSGLGGFEPQLFVNTAGALETKLRALGKYSSEMRKWPHPRSERGLSAYSDFRGLMSGFQGAEAFSVFRLCFP